ncbi:MAG: hypothetical protein QXZ70_00790 [Candidatus Bathyarchaeia archaeon]
MTLQRTVMLFAFIVLLALFTQTVVNISFCSDKSRKIDVFTNKAPFDGRGINKASDAFEPQELVRLYALVTFNEEPIPNRLVAFQINNPPNSFRNMTIISVNITDYEGIATFCFRIPWPYENAEQIIFGEWKVVATVNVDGEVVMDTLTYQVEWIIQITDAQTLNAELEPQTEFRREERIIFNLVIKNIAMTAKNATIIIDVKDSSDYSIIHIKEIQNFQPGENYIQIVSEIPTVATIGRAIISIAALTAPPEYGGTPYCPPVSLQIDIVTPIKYYLTVKTEPFGIASIPGEGWYNEGTIINLTAPDTVLVSPGTRYKFSHWKVDGVTWINSSINLLMNRNHTAIAYYNIQYFLSVRTSPAGIAIIPGEGWYDVFVNVSLSAPSVEGYDFIHWDVDGIAKDSGVHKIVICMDGPHAATAHYKVIYEAKWLYLLLIVILIMLIILLGIMAYRRVKRKRNEKEAFKKGWIAWYYGYNILGRYESNMHNVQLTR